MKKKLAIALSTLVILSSTPKPANAQVLNAVRNLASQFLPVLEQYLGEYLGPIFEGYTDIVTDLISEGFSQVLDGNFRLDRLIGTAIPDLADQVANETGLPEGALRDIGYGVVRTDRDRLIDGGLAILLDRLRGSGTQNPNGTVIGGATGPNPTVPGSPGGGVGRNGIPDLPGIPQPRGNPQPGPIGVASCRYSTTCTGSLPSVFTQIFEDATGDLEIIDPIQVQSRVYELARVGATTDVISATAHAGATFASNDITRELTRLYTQNYLSTEAQALRVEQQEAVVDLLDTKSMQVRNGLASQSSQEVLKSLLSTNAVVPDLLAADVQLSQRQLESDQYQSLNLANVSEIMDWERRERDTELNAARWAAAEKLFGSSPVIIPTGTHDLDFD